MELSLVIFDVDGTLIDSQHDIMHSMQAAFADVGLPAPLLSDVLSVVGLSLPTAIARLAGRQPETMLLRMAETYRQTYSALRELRRPESSPLYPGARDAIEALHARPEVLLGVATGKARRGLDHVFAVHDLDVFFVTRQTADHHPSKPHPAMIAAALAETGVAPERAVMVGDTTFDVEMARAAGIAAIGVGWGYHPPESLAAAGAVGVIHDFAELVPAIESLWGVSS